MKKMFFALPLSLLLFSACSGSNSDTYSNGNDTTAPDTSTQTTPAGTDVTSPSTTTTPTLQTALPAKGDQVAVITTDYGDITVRLFPDQAPKAVQNFTTHIKDGYYNNLIFHRVIDGFMIQGGDPEGTGRGGESIWKQPFEDEFSPSLSNIRGALAMANAGPNTNGSQFFIDQVNNTYLDGHHTVFGQVISGMDAVDKIAKVEKGPNDKPVKDVKMTIKMMPYAG